MDTIKSIKKALIAGGVSWRHVQRYGRELQHHYEDLVDKAVAAGFDEASAAHWAERELGDPDILVGEMVNKPELQCLGARFPKLVFLAMPLASFLLALVVIVLTIVAYMSQFYPSSQGPYEYPEILVFSMDAIRLFVMHGLAPLLSCGFLVYGLRQDISRKWLYTGVFLVILLSSALFVQVIWPDPARNITQGSIGASLGFGLFDLRGVTDPKIRLVLMLAMLGLFSRWYQKRLGRE